jgi:hypothetical protein
MPRAIAGLVEREERGIPLVEADDGEIVRKIPQLGLTAVAVRRGVLEPVCLRIERDPSDNMTVG